MSISEIKYNLTYTKWRTRSWVTNGELTWLSVTACFLVRVTISSLALLGRLANLHGRLRSMVVLWNLSNRAGWTWWSQKLPKQQQYIATITMVLFHCWQYLKPLSNKWFTNPFKCDKSLASPYIEVYLIKPRFTTGIRGNLTLISQMSWLMTSASNSRNTYFNPCSSGSKPCFLQTSSRTWKTIHIRRILHFMMAHLTKKS